MTEANFVGRVQTVVFRTYEDCQRSPCIHCAGYGESRKGDDTLCPRQGVPVLVDGAQSIPHMPVDVQDLDADFYVFSGHKVYGPTGVGVLYGKEEWLDKMPPYQGGGEMIQHVSFERTTFNELPFKFEAGTPDYIGTTGLAMLDYVSAIGMEKIAAHEHELTTYAHDTFERDSACASFGEAGRERECYFFPCRRYSSFRHGDAARPFGHCRTYGHHCAQPLMQRLALKERCASFGLYNTKEEIDVLVAGIERVSRMF